MHSLVFFTGSRSEFGHIKPIIEAIQGRASITVLAGGAHGLERGKEGRRELEEFCKSRDVSFSILGSGSGGRDSGCEQVALVSNTMIDISRSLATIQPDMMVCIGDRWELFSATVPATILGTRLCHISGGEITLGAIDNKIRKATSKLADLHLVANSECRNVLIKQGVDPETVKITGEPGLDYIHSARSKRPLKDICEQFRIPCKESAQYVLVTYHPCSYGNIEKTSFEVLELVKSIENCSEYTFIVTGPGHEQESSYVRTFLIEYVKNRTNMHYVESLGRENYLELLKRSAFVLGNSSSALIEAPSFGVPSINVGERQQGRIRANSVVDCECKSSEIVEAIKLVTSTSFKLKVMDCSNPYDPYKDGKNCERIADECLGFLKFQES